jgi:peptidoglycan-N-acetylglucosamine deacetylase
MKIEFSFDDGHVSDMRVAKLLSQYGFKGTFYNTNIQLNGTIKMSLKEMADTLLKEGHEIGSHTITHPMDMKGCGDEQLKFELENSKYGPEKAMSKSLAGRKITKFCYPRGRHDERVRKAVKDAGYEEARTTRVLQVQNDTGDPYQTPTTIHMFPRKEYNGVPWYDMAVKEFNRAAEIEKGGAKDVFFHVWGHSKELDAYDYWEQFEDLLRFLRTQLSTV